MGRAALAAAPYDELVRDLSAFDGADRLRPGEVHVRYVGLDHPLADAGACLDAGEVRRARRFRREQDRRRFRAAHCALRHLVAGYLGCAPAEVRLCRRCARCGHPSHGKPAVLEPMGGHAIEVSLSRGGGVAAMAVCLPPLVVGVDLEPVRVGVDWTAILPAGAGGDGDADGFRAWTRLEAVVKAAGVGLLAVPRIESGAADGWASARLPGSARTWHVRSLAAPQGFAAALAANQVPPLGVRVSTAIEEGHRGSGELATRR